MIIDDDRAYAAIHLCMPESGDAELDVMIRKAQRYRLEEMALQGMLVNAKFHPGDDNPLQRYSVFARLATDAMIAARERGT